MALVRFVHVFPDGGMTAARAAAGMDGDALVVVEDLDHAVSKANIDTFADQAVRHGLEAVQHVDVVIGMDLGLLPFRILEGFRRQRAQGGTLDLVEQVTA